MKNSFIVLTAIAMLSTACEKSKPAEESAAPEVAEKKAPVTLTLKWETDPLLTTCESVLYDKDQDLLYVSNINGAPDGKDGNGFISQVSLDGKIVNANWAKGMDAPKGMGLSNGKLYVADIDKVREIDTKTGKVVRTYPVAGAVFLNDISVDDKGKVYISDSSGGTIYTLENGKVIPWMKDLAGPNGLFAEDAKMVVALWNGKSLNTIEGDNREVTLRADSIDNPDGIESIGGNAYLVSSWNGMIHHIDSDWKKTLILDTRADSISAADIEYIKEKDLLLVPTFFKNKVMAYELKKN
jgi:DNA-binding beta-propeller fold protein YncE